MNLNIISDVSQFIENPKNAMTVVASDGLLVPV